MKFEMMDTQNPTPITHHPSPDHQVMNTMKFEMMDTQQKMMKKVEDASNQQLEYAKESSTEFRKQVS